MKIHGCLEMAYLLFNTRNKYGAPMYYYLYIFWSFENDKSAFINRLRNDMTRSFFHKL